MWSTKFSEPRLVVLAGLLLALCLLFLRTLVPSQRKVFFLGAQTDEKEERIYTRLSELESVIQDLWCENHKTLYSGGYCLHSKKPVIAGNLLFDVGLCKHIEILAKHESVGDFGAGLGWYGMCLLKKNDTSFKLSSKEGNVYMNQFKNRMGSFLETPQVVYSWQGYDGASNIDTISGGFIKHQDLSKKDLWLGRQWDWVLCIDVGEHIPEQKETAFLDNVVRHACKGVVVSWAIEGQKGRGHINTHNNDYIKERMVERGMVNDLEFENEMRQNLTLDWMKNSTMVFRFPDPLDCLEF